MHTIYISKLIMLINDMLYFTIKEKKNKYIVKLKFE